jgi:miniconductance mechanosensitive channel
MTSTMEWLSTHASIREVVVVGVTLGAALASLLVARYVFIRAINFLLRRTKAGWDEALVHRRVLEKLAYLAPAAIVSYSTKLYAHETHPLVLRLLDAVIVVVLGVASSSALDAGLDVHERSRLAKEIPIKGYVQVARLIIVLASAVVIVSILLDRSPWYFLSGLGAATAILLLVFKDTITSFVASVQIASNDILRIGDAIEMPKYNADGEVVDIALHTVKVQNGDLTITTVPTAKFIEDAFKNWRGVQRAGARRIARAILIDEKSITFLDPPAIDRLSRIQLLSPYLRERAVEIERDNKDKGIELSSPVNGRRMTNVGTFRAYIAAYVRSLAAVRKDMPLVVRQLAPTANGLPIELYLFVNETDWARYEGIQADIFDHLLAAVPEFGLRVFQNPTS